MEVYVVLNAEMGWDNVLGVWSTREAALKYCKDYDNTPTGEEWDRSDSSIYILESMLDYDEQ